MPVSSAQYEYAAPQPAPASASTPPSRLSPSVEAGTLLQGRWRISAERAIFDDSVATIYRARDAKDSREVAVKVYRDSGALSLQKFRRSVELLLTFRGRFSSKGCRLEGSQNLELLLEELRAHTDLAEHATAHSFLGSMDFRSCFVELISYSHGKEWMPALDTDSNLLFIVLELGETSLRERMIECIHQRQTLTAEEIGQIHWALVTIVCGLHTEGYLHLDIKPATLFRYRTPRGGETWKLIDLDGAVRTGSQVRLCDLSYTPEYAPPELAQLYLRNQREGGRIKLSRSMNVWSAGMCALEAVSLMPVFNLKYSWYEKWKQLKGSSTNFLAAIAGEKASLGVVKLIPEDLHNAMVYVSEEMADLMEGMLVKEEKQRFTITQCVLHRWFAAKRKAVLDARWGVEEDEDNVDSAEDKPQVVDPDSPQIDLANPDELRAYIKAQLGRPAAETPGPEAGERPGPAEEPPAPQGSGAREARACVLM